MKFNKRARSRFSCQLPVADGATGTSCDLSRTGLGAVFARRHRPDESLTVRIASHDGRTWVLLSATVAHSTRVAGKTVTGIRFHRPLSLDELDALLRP
jgi:hypothetical protein